MMLKSRGMLFGLLVAAATPAAAQPGQQDEPIADRAAQAARQPAEDINAVQDKIPEKLLAIAGDPYALAGMRACRQIAAEVAELDAVLGPDVDAGPPPKRSAADKAIDVGGSLLGGLIPFRGIVREVSGANAAERRFEAAVYAGVTRRSFLKGVGRTKGCKPPAAPRPIEVVPATPPQAQ